MSPGRPACSRSLLMLFTGIILLWKGLAGHYHHLVQSKSTVNHREEALDDKFVGQDASGPVCRRLQDYLHHLRALTNSSAGGRWSYGNNLRFPVGFCGTYQAGLQTPAEICEPPQHIHVTIKDAYPGTRMRQGSALSQRAVILGTIQVYTWTYQASKWFAIHTYTDVLLSL